MIQLVHGNALVAISKKISDIKKNFDLLEISEISVKDTDISSVLTNLAGQGLFSEKRLVSLDNLTDDFPLDKIEVDDPNLNLVFRVNKQLGVRDALLSWVQSKKGQVINLSEKDEVSIFPFLDMLGMKDKRAMEQMDGIIDEMGGQYLISMLFYFYRRLLSPSKGADFMKAKIESQKKNFNLNKVTNLYKYTLETDYKIKNGLIDERIGIALIANKILT